MTSERRRLVVTTSWLTSSSFGFMAIFVESFMINTNQEKIVNLFRWLHEIGEYEIIENLYNWMGEYIEYLYGDEHEDLRVVKRVSKRLSNIRKWLEAIEYV